jgi:hypothetical protein
MSWMPFIAQACLLEMGGLYIAATQGVEEHDLVIVIHGACAPQR